MLFATLGADYYAAAILDPVPMPILFMMLAAVNATGSLVFSAHGLVNAVVTHIVHHLPPN
jgi:hypothetical protein